MRQREQSVVGREAMEVSDDPLVPLDTRPILAWLAEQGMADHAITGYFVTRDGQTFIDLQSMALPERRKLRRAISRSSRLMPAAMQWLILAEALGLPTDRPRR